ncbi:MAG: WecB/TagA/CpsF family glycosyltransferase [Pseudomonadota bacterium]
MSEHGHVLEQRIDISNYEAATAQIMAWAGDRKSAQITLSNVYSVMLAHDDREFLRVTTDSDLVLPDGMPLVLALRSLGLKGVSRVYGPDLMLHLCAAAAQAGVGVALYGGRPDSLVDLESRLIQRFSGLHVACAIAPPFQPLNEQEEAAVVKNIAESGAGILFVGTGCPRQELWIARYLDQLAMPILGVGAAFDFHSGRMAQAPAWMQRLSLEWLFRLAMEPRRLWRRYLIHNPRFLWHFAGQFLRERVLNRGGTRA